MVINRPCILIYAEDADQDAEDGDHQQAEDGGGGEESPNEQGE